MDLGLGQVDQQVTGPPAQDVVQGQPHVGHSVHVKPARDTDLLAETRLCDVHGQGAYCGQRHFRLPQVLLAAEPPVASVHRYPLRHRIIIRRAVIVGSHPRAPRRGDAHRARTSDVRRLVRFAGDVGSESAQRLVETRITAVDVVGMADRRDPIGDQAGDDQRRPRPDVAGLDRSAG